MNILDALRGEKEKLEQQLNAINGAIAVLGGGRSQNTGNGRKHRNGWRRRKSSAAARKRMSLAKKQWWAAKAKATKS